MQFSVRLSITNCGTIFRAGVRIVAFAREKICNKVYIYVRKIMQVSFVGVNALVTYCFRNLSPTLIIFHRDLFLLCSNQNIGHRIDNF